MVTYPHVQLAKFRQRPNRFIAHCELKPTHEKVVAHVKNTGRCQELLIPGATVALSYQASATRKTDYDLIAVKKGEQWINIDSQVPNQLAYEGIKSGQIKLPHKPTVKKLQQEVKLANSRFDLVLTDSQAEETIIEVKGVTLENQGLVAFPDAPTRRGLKHVEELTRLAKEGQKVLLLFIVQLSGAKEMTLFKEMDPAFYAAVKAGLTAGLEVLVYQSEVTAETISLTSPLPFNLAREFINPNP